MASSTSVRPIYPRAPVSLMLRAWDRNSSEVDNLENRISAVARDWFGGAFPAVHDRKLQFGAEVLYFAVTLLLGRTTLGEEQSGLALVHPQIVSGGNGNSNNNTRRTFLVPPSRVRLIANFAAHLAVPHILRKVWEYFFPEQDASDGVRRVLLVHAAWWWLWSSSSSASMTWVPESIAARLSGLTSVSTDMKLFAPAQQSSEQYTFLGGLTLLRVAVELFIWGRERWRNRQVDRTVLGGRDEQHQAERQAQQQQQQQQQQTQQDRTPTAAAATTDVTAATSETCSLAPQSTNNHSNTGTCPLCLAHRVNPTATSCGHVFCWNCLSELLESGSGGVEPRCPLCREVVRPQSFVLLQNFSVPRNS